MVRLRFKEHCGLADLRVHQRHRRGSPLIHPYIIYQLGDIWIIPHRIRVWYIFDGIHVTIYSSTMDPMGYREYWLLMIIVYCHCCRVIIATFLVFAWVILLLWLLDIQCRSMQYISHHLMGSWWTARLMTCLCCQISIGWRQDCWIWDGSVQKLAICCNIHCNTLW